MNMIETVTTHEPERADTNYVMSCRVCGATVTDWRLHKRWHEKQGDAIDQPAADTQS